ncbi:hypothetical protein BDB00DRAFT_843243 [Zychaea mexicana]|uniref:uncharacterized protein n=1 Tax=Zychaea mexicana TaxID=64656 RepID=UPI0022FEA931|nr:uncharacterized protein BDB00DRAFT_843243 [Zychaea mexicana]KAI9489398.1 hypothetical protein BDB00DRAFT_843243 [Zychaea mexicana]
MNALAKIAQFSVGLQQRAYVSVKFMRPKKFNSILEHVPPRPRSGWQIYIREHMKDYSPESGKINVAQATKELSTKWRVMSETDKQKYVDMYKKETAAHFEAYEKAMQTATPQQIYHENLLRKKFKLKVLPDPHAPKRPPMNGYMYYLKERRNDPSFMKMPLMEQAGQASKEYKVLSDNDKKGYVDTAKKALDKYHAEKKDYLARMTQSQ